MGEALSSADKRVARPSTSPRANGTPTRARRWLTGYPRAIPLAIFLAVCVITAISVFAIESNARTREQVELEAYAGSIVSTLEQRGTSFSSYLRAGAALVASGNEVTPQTFQDFVEELGIDTTYRGAEGIGLAEIVDADQVDGFAQRVRMEQPDFPVPALNKNLQSSTLAPITYFSSGETSSGEKLGFDLFSDEVRSTAMHEAHNTALPTASGRIDLARSGPEGGPGFVIFMPVFKDTPQSQGDQRELAGFVFAPFHAGRFLDAAIEGAAPDQYGVRLYDGSKDTRHLLVARPLNDTVSGQFELPVTIANRTLQLVIETNRSAALAPLSMLTLLFGLSVAFLMMVLARLLTQQAFEDQSRLAFFEEQHSIRNTLTRELNHRVKNTLANVLSILSLTRRRATHLDEFADGLEGRIRALSATHDLLTGTDWGTTPIAAVVEAELRQFKAAADHEILVDGPDVELAPNDALSFGLAIHELATNAAKFGALSVPDGTVSLKWSLISKDLAEVAWSEHGGPLVSQERSSGFGTELIEKVIAHELKNPVDLSFNPGGVQCVMRVPVRRRANFKIREER